MHNYIQLKCKINSFVNIKKIINFGNLRKITATPENNSGFASVHLLQIRVLFSYSLSIKKTIKSTYRTSTGQMRPRQRKISRSPSPKQFPFAFFLLQLPFYYRLCITYNGYIFQNYFKRYQL